MNEPSISRLILRSLLRPLTGLSAADLEYCCLRDRLWAQYKKSRFFSRYFSEVEIFNQSIRFIRFEDFMRVLEEVFGKRIYAFKTESKRPLILDLGANIGMSILFFKRIWPESRILAFEPDPRTFEVLQHNVKTNAWKNVELHNFALSGQEGETYFYTDPTGNFSLESSVYGSRVPGAVKHRVKTAPLSRFLGQTVDFVKMDIEGSEGEVLQELASSGSLSRIKAMAIEYHHHLVPEEDKLAAFLKILEGDEFGYKVFSPFEHPDAGKHFQDILIHAWKK